MPGKRRYEEPTFRRSNAFDAVAEECRAVREAVYRTWSDYAEGALRREGKRWVPVDLFSGVLLDPPYFLEVGEDDSDSAESPADASVLWGDMTWPVA